MILATLSIEELHKKIAQENHRFYFGMEKGFAFGDLKQIRRKIKAITLEIKNRTISNTPSNNIE